MAKLRSRRPKAPALTYDFTVREFPDVRMVGGRSWTIRMQGSNPERMNGVVTARFRKLHPDVLATVLVTGWVQVEPS